MRRFFVEKIKRAADGSCVITGGEARHILKVLRMARGDGFILMDRTGNSYEAVIESVNGNEVTAGLTEKLHCPALPDLEITLCQAMIKSGPMDFLIEKTSELGVTSIMPFASERSVVRIAGTGNSNKLRRWREIAISATKQAGRIAPAEISDPVPFPEILKQYKEADSMKVILWEKEGARDLREVLKATGECRHFIGMVGPEGGFTTHEAAAAEQAGFMPVSLGRRILRAETAAITLVAVVQYEYGDLSLNNR
jgi:16S rRNA (uracil1498-N3)-methyltransferase